jgi:hypothetical protein
MHGCIHIGLALTAVSVEGRLASWAGGGYCPPFRCNFVIITTILDR